MSGRNAEKGDWGEGGRKSYHRIESSFAMRPNQEFYL